VSNNTTKVPQILREDYFEEFKPNFKVIKEKIKYKFSSNDDEDILEDKNNSNKELGPVLINKNVNININQDYNQEESKEDLSGYKKFSKKMIIIEALKKFFLKEKYKIQVQEKQKLFEQLLLNTLKGSINKSSTNYKRLYCLLRNSGFLDLLLEDDPSILKNFEPSSSSGSKSSSKDTKRNENTTVNCNDSGSSEENIIESNLKNFNQIRNKSNSDSSSDKVNEDLFLKPILVLDLDETLIHSETPVDTLKHYDFKIMENKVGVFMRSSLFTFLEKAKKDFNLVLFSAGRKDYINEVVKRLKLSTYFLFILDNEYCINIKDKFYIKDLEIFDCLTKNLMGKPVHDETSYVKFKNKGLSLDSFQKEYIKIPCFIIDNNIFSFANNLNQGILINPFYGESLRTLTTKENSDNHRIKRKAEEELITILRLLRKVIHFKFPPI
jgi:hypothetical protein